MSEKSIDRMNNTLFDPAFLNDPVAMKTDWSPAKSGGTNIRTHKLVSVNRHRMQFRATSGAKLFYLVFLIAGMVVIGFSFSNLAAAGDYFDRETIVPLLFGLLFSCAGGGLLYFGADPIVFDRGKGLFWKGRKEPYELFNNRAPKYCAEFGYIHALQIVSEGCGSSDERFKSYELNIVLKNGERINVVDHGNLDKLKDDAAVLSDFMGKPVWDTSHIDSKSVQAQEAVEDFIDSVLDQEGGEEFLNKVANTVDKVAKGGRFLETVIATVTRWLARIFGVFMILIGLAVITTDAKLVGIVILYFGVLIAAGDLMGPRMQDVMDGLLFVIVGAALLSSGYASYQTDKESIAAVIVLMVQGLGLSGIGIFSSYQRLKQSKRRGIKKNYFLNIIGGFIIIISLAVMGSGGIDQKLVGNVFLYFGVFITAINFAGPRMRYVMEGLLFVIFGVPFFFIGYSSYKTGNESMETSIVPMVFALGFAGIGIFSVYRRMRQGNP